VCPYCGAGCGLYVIVENGRITGVEPDPEHPVNEGELCIKGYYGYHHVHDENRLTSPLIKKEGRFIPVSWDEALNYVAARLTKIIREHGPDVCYVTTSGRVTNEDNFAGMKFARAVLGTNNVDVCARV